MKNENKLKKEVQNSLTGARRQMPLRKIEGKRQENWIESGPVEEREKVPLKSFEQ